MTVLEAHRSAFVPQSQVITWQPLKQQYLERDTLFLLDPVLQQSLTPNDGLVQHIDFDVGLNTYVADPEWSNVSTYVSVVDGKYRSGITSSDATHGSLQLPMEVIPGSTFTIEFWMKATAAWSTLGDLRPITIANNGIVIKTGSNLLSATYGHFFDSSVQTAYTLTHSFSSYDVAADTWAHIALTSDGSNLTLYLDGVQRARQTSISPPHNWTTYRGSGLTLLARPITSAKQITMSDLRISRECRTPGTTATISGRPTITVSSTATGATLNQKLLGGVQGLGNAYTITNAAPYMNVMRADHFLDTAPIKAGGTDATHPTAGQSGAYSYDWQVADRTTDYLFNTLGADEMYLSIDLTPQILGGTKAPASGTDLTTKRTNQITGETSARPSDLTEMAKIVKDLLYHITVEQGRTITHVGIWNEPAGGQLSGTNEADKRLYYTQSLYPVLAQAVKDFDPTLKVGGPEVAGGNESDLLWVSDLITYCAANSVPLDFISWHWYSSDINEIPLWRSRVDAMCAAHSFPTLELCIGEWTVGNSWPVQFASLPLDPEHVDIGAAYVARGLIGMQRANVTRACVYGVEDTLDPNFTPDGALLTSTHKWPTLNVFQQWATMHSTVVGTTLTNSPPFIDAIATKSGSTYDVLIACMSWLKTRDWKVDVAVPVADGTPVTVYVVDDAHSNYTEAGSGHQDLESYDGGTVSNGTVTVTLRPRSSALVRIG